MAVYLIAKSSRFNDMQVPRGVDRGRRAGTTGAIWGEYVGRICGPGGRQGTVCGQGW